MEKNINKKVNNYMNDYKQELIKWLDDNNTQNSDENKEFYRNFKQYIIDYPHIELTSDDFKKRKRIKNNIADYDRCIALKCNGERCSRKKKSDNFCGTHFKGTPYGTTTTASCVKKETIKVWLQEINGISKYIDKDNNVYSTVDITNMIDSPRIIGKCEKNKDNNLYYMINN